MSRLSNVLCSLLFVVAVCDAKRVKLKDVQTLTLYSDKWTTSRRSSPIKQLTCVGGYCSRAKIPVAQCYNRGFDGQDVQWECKAEMPSNYKLGKVQVSCEGYDYPEDDYILAGSCGLEYTIDELNPSKSSSYFHDNSYYSSDKSTSGSYMPIIIMLGVMFLIYWNCLRDSNVHSNSRSDDSQDRPGWGFGPGPSAPPPPPGFRPDYYSDDSCHRTRSTGTSSGPGFFSGMAAGGMLGYLFGSGGSGTRGYRRRYDDYNDSYWNTPSTSGFSSGSGTTTSTSFGSTTRR